MRRILFLILILVFIAGCSGVAYPEKSAKGEPMKLMYISDLHHLAPELYEHGELFHRVIEFGDGKILQYTSEILDALVDEILRIQPDGVILAGDLTFNGERQSHLEVAAKMRQACGTGINIYAIPGNHDVHNPWTYTYYGDDKPQGIPSTTSSEFQSIYSGCGVAGALSIDKNSLGFVFPLAEDMWLLALDANTPENPGAFSKETYNWVEDQLKKASEQGIHVLPISHQTLIDHNVIINEDYTIRDNSRMVKLLERYGIHVNFSAHIHIQHIAREDGFTDIATGAVSVYPHLYGLIEIDEYRNITYSANPLPLPEEILTESEDLFARTSDRRIEFNIGNRVLDRETYMEMNRWAKVLNNQYYRGQPIDPALAEDPAKGLWEEHASQTHMGRYLLSIFDEEKMDHRSIFIERQ